MNEKIKKLLESRDGDNIRLGLQLLFAEAPTEYVKYITCYAKTISMDARGDLSISSLDFPITLHEDFSIPFSVGDTVVLKGTAHPIMVVTGFSVSLMNQSSFFSTAGTSPKVINANVTFYSKNSQSFNTAILNVLCLEKVGKGNQNQQEQ